MKSIQKSPENYQAEIQAKMQKWKNFNYYISNYDGEDDNSHPKFPSYNQELLQKFVECGKINIHEKDFENVNTLMTAILFCNFETLMLLLPQCSKKIIDEPDKYGNTCLMIAAKHNNHNIIPHLLNKKANIHLKSGLGDSATLLVAEHCPQHLLSFFEQNLIDLQEHQETNKNILHYLVTSSSTSSVLKNVMTYDNVNLLINKQDKDGNTPLHIAIEHSNLEAISILMNSGSIDSIHIQNNKGQYPIDMNCGDMAKKSLIEDEYIKWTLMITKQDLKQTKAKIL